MVHWFITGFTPKTERGVTVTTLDFSGQTCRLENVLLSLIAGEQPLKEGQTSPNRVSPFTTKGLKVICDVTSAL